jgi:hypothetical protein
LASHSGRRRCKKPGVHSICTTAVVSARIKDLQHSRYSTGSTQVLRVVMLWYASNTRHGRQMMCCTAANSYAAQHRSCPRHVQISPLAYHIKMCLWFAGMLLSLAATETRPLQQIRHECSWLWGSHWAALRA